jgi:hypothetical protein
MPIEADAVFLDRKPLMDLYDRELFRAWVLQQFISEQLRLREIHEAELLAVRQRVELDEKELKRVLEKMELQKALASKHERAKKKEDSKKENPSAAGLLALLRSKRLSEIKKYKSE